MQVQDFGALNEINSADSAWHQQGTSRFSGLFCARESNVPDFKHLPKIGNFVTRFDGREIVYWEDPRSIRWLSRTPCNRAFARLVRFYEPQADKFMCGPASVAIVLNALKCEGGCELPIDLEHESFPRRFNPGLPLDYRASFPKFTQRNIFEDGRGLKAIERVYGQPDVSGTSSPGLTLKEMHELLTAHGVHSQLRPVTFETKAGHAEDIAYALQTDGVYIIANFDRTVWGLEGDGHVSLIGAYDLITRKALIVDVNVYGRWLWIDIDLLVASMASADNGTPRGYLLVSKTRGTSTTSI